MRFLRVIGILVLFISVLAMASENKLGIHEVSHVRFDSPTRIGSVVLPAGEYTVRHSMEGEEHVMAFQQASGKKEVFRVKCTLVQLPQKAEKNQSVYELTSSNEKVLRELVFRGDTAKHVF